jgi:Rrf2 family protein
MRISKKCQYALRAVLELAFSGDGRRPVKVQHIAAAQGIPPRFLEVILNQLRHAGIVESLRGKKGGYILAQNAGDLTVGRIIRHIQGPVLAVAAEAGNDTAGGSFRGDRAFGQLWEQAAAALAGVYDGTTFAELLEREKAAVEVSVASYSI